MKKLMRNGKNIQQDELWELNQKTDPVYFTGEAMTEVSDQLKMATDSSLTLSETRNSASMSLNETRN